MKWVQMQIVSTLYRDLWLQKNHARLHPHHIIAAIL